MQATGAGCPGLVEGWVRIRDSSGQVIWGPRRSSNRIVPKASVADIQRVVENDTLNVEVFDQMMLPTLGTWTSVDAAVVPANFTQYPSPPSQWMVSVPIQIQHKDPVTILGVPMDYQHAEAPASLRGTPNNNLLAPGIAPDEVFAAWPFTKYSRYTRHNKAVQITTLVNGHTGVGIFEVIAAVQRHLRETMGPRPDMIFAFFKGSASDWGTGWSCLGCNGVGNTDTTIYQALFAHETGHHFANASHAGSFIGEVGWDNLNWLGVGRPKVPDSIHNLMCCANPTRETWIRPYQYEAMIDQIPWTPTGGGVQLYNTTAIHVDVSGAPEQWTITRAVDLQTSSTPIVSTSGGSGLIRLLDSSSAELYRSSFDRPVEDGIGPITHFTVEVPRLTNVHSVELSWQGQVVTTRTRSANAPTVTITSPTTGANINNLSSVTWAASDADGDNLEATIEYSMDGIKQIPIDAYVSGASVAFDPSLVPGGQAVSIRVRITDGMNTTVATVGSLQKTTDLPPEAYIATPLNGEAYLSSPLEVSALTNRPCSSVIQVPRVRVVQAVCLVGAGVRLDAYVRDPEDGWMGEVAPAVASVYWSSSLQGALGTGRSLEVNLIPGQHTITLTVTDSGGNQVADAVTITVTQ